MNTAAHGARRATAAIPRYFGIGSENGPFEMVVEGPVLPATETEAVTVTPVGSCAVPRIGEDAFTRPTWAVVAGRPPHPA